MTPHATFPKLASKSSSITLLSFIIVPSQETQSEYRLGDYSSQVKTFDPVTCRKSGWAFVVAC